MLIASGALAVVLPSCGDSSSESDKGSLDSSLSDASDAVNDAISEADVSDAGPLDAESGSTAPSHSCEPAKGVIPSLGTVLIAEGLSLPVGLAASASDTSRLYVLEKGGVVRLIKDGSILPAPFLDLSASVWDEGEAGLLGMDFHPDYATNGRFWSYYTTDATDGSHLAEFRRSSSDHDVAAPEPIGGAPVFKTLRSFIHQGGGLEFGPDGFLYLGLGERGSGKLAEDLSSPLGKIIRLDVSTYPYFAPVGNVPGAHPLVWDYGLRNPWRISFDRCDGTLFIADVGEFLREEINIEPVGKGNRNYGWPMTEGTLCMLDGGTCDTSKVTLPAIEYPHDKMGVIIGGYTYRGHGIPGLRSRYVYGDTGGHIYSLSHSGGVVTDASQLPIPPLPGVLVSFGQDAAGEIYTVEMQSGTIRRLVAQ